MASRVKSRADKSRDKDKAGAATNKDSVTAASTAHEIVAGKFSESEWHQLILDEENESFCYSILEELLELAMRQCYQKYIERQLLPFTVEIAKESLLEVVELRFLERDFGETEAQFDSEWLEDEEPEPVMFDCWAVGAVPCTMFASEDADSMTRTERSLKDYESALPSQNIASQDDFDPEVNGDADNPEEVPDQDEIEDIQIPVPVLNEETKVVAKPKRKYKPHVGPIGSAGVSRMSETLLETELRLMHLDQKVEERMTSSEMPAKMQQALKAQAGRPPGLGEAPVKDVNVVIVDSRAVMENFASIQVKTNFSVVDPEVEAAQQRLIAMRTGRFNPASIERTVKKTKKDGKEGKKQTQEFRNEQQQTYERAASNGVAPVPPPLIESMDVAPGVTVREGGRVKQGPKRLQKQSSSNRHFTDSLLLPVNRLKPKTKITVAEIINPIQPKTVAKPLPPIS